MKKLTEKDIIKILSKYDMIVPQKKHLRTSIIKSIRTKKEIESNPNTRHESSHKREDYYLLREIIKEKTPEYLENYDEMLNCKTVYLNNMFICKKEVFDEYCDWLFDILEEFRNQTDFSTYGKNKRVLDYLSERLLQVFINKHNLSVKEKYLLQTHIKIPFSVILENKFPIISKILNKLFYIFNK